MKLRTHLCCFAVLVCSIASGEEVFSIIPTTGSLSGKVKAVKESEVIFVGLNGRERRIPFVDLMPRDIYRCRRQLVKPDDADSLFQLGKYCADNGFPSDAFEMWEAAEKAAPHKLSDQIRPAWNQLVSQLKKSDRLSPPRKPLDPAFLKKLPQRTALRLRVLEAGIPYAFPKVPWEKRRKIRTRHYDIETNVPEMTGKYLMVLLEQLYTYYAKRLGTAPSTRLTVYVFASRADFQRQAAAAGHPIGPTVGGFYLQHPSPTRCAIYMPWVMQGRHTPTSVLMHECFHQFYHRVFNKGEPIWFNEGMATYFEASIFNGEKIIDGCINPARLRALQRMFRDGKAEPLSSLLKRDRHFFQAPQYAEAWAFVYWMAWGKPTKRERTIMQNRLMAFIRSIKHTTPNLELFEKTTRLRLNDLDREWEEWVLSLNPDDPFGGKGDPRK